eukprot:3836817-Rhodomonas_salina.1
MQWGGFLREQRVSCRECPSEVTEHDDLVRDSPRLTHNLPTYSENLKLIRAASTEYMSSPAYGVSHAHAAWCAGKRLEREAYLRHFATASRIRCPPSWESSCH